MQSENNLDSYFFSFKETGIFEIDKILSEIAWAGKKHHNIEGWIDRSEKSSIQHIQEAADAAAAEMRKLKAA